MQVLVRKSDIAADCSCSICGQEFRLYWEAGTPEQQARAQIEIRDAIHSQHVNGAARSAHPEVPFTVPNWAAIPQFATPPPAPPSAPPASAPPISPSPAPANSKQPKALYVSSCE